MVATAAQIKTILQTGVYPNEITSDHIFDYKQVDKRRFYPSIEILPKNDLSRYDRKRNEKSLGFEVKIYVKRIGQMSDEIAFLETTENEVESLLREGNLVDNRIILATANWKRDYIDDRGPNYVVSTLTFRVTELAPPDSGFSMDGFLIYDISNSDGDNPPGADYQYTSVFDSEISEGYSSTDENTVKNPDDGEGVPIHFAGIFTGTFITHFTVGINDVGETDDKIQKLKSLKSNGEKPQIGFMYNDKDNAPMPNTILEVTFVELDQIQRLYKHNELVIYRAIGKVIKPGTLTIS